METNQANDSNSEFQKTDALRKIISLRNISKVVPVISNSFRLEQVFQNESRITEQIPERSEFLDEDFTIEEQLTRVWAEQIEYPMSDRHNLARVAQYHQVEHDGSDVAKEEYLEFLNSYLLDINTGTPDYDDVVQQLKRDSIARSFSEIVRMLDYPRFPENSEDPLALLAKMPFPIYITTSYHDFLECALQAEDKKPRTQLIFWEEGREYDDAGEHKPDPDFVPTTQTPAVYHLFGLENYPSSLVLSEDDYMRFLISVVSVTDTQKPIVPLRLRQALASSHLFLLGYHLRDWDFRVLFRFILNYRIADPKQGICIQMKPKRGNQHATEYLHHYFNRQRFDVAWKSSDEFIHELWNIYRGQ